MRLAHISDLHIGKRVNEFSMLADQRHILWQMLDIFDEEKIDGVIIAGDVYDKSTPITEAVTLFDELLYELAKRELYVFIISGNHDSSERLAFGGRLFKENKIFISPVYNGEISPVTINDENGEINFYLLPFIKPSSVRKYNECEVSTYTEALSLVIEKMNVDKSKRNILVTHEFVTGAQRSESEEISVGGSDNVDCEIMADFDYVALGHLHKPQSVTESKIRYCGTPLKYSFSEANDKKTVTVLDIREKGSLEITERELKPLRDLVEIKGTYEEITKKDFYQDTGLQNDYVHITLTNEDDVVDALAKLRLVYPYLMKLDYDNQRTRASYDISGAENVENKTPLELFSELFALQNDREMSKEQSELLAKLIEEIWEGEI